MATFPGTPSANWVRLNSFYNGNSYDPVQNPGGMANNGHRQNFVPALQDVAEVGSEVAAMAAQCQTYASSTFSQQTSWNPQTPLPASYVNATTFTVTGNEVSLFLPNGVSGRALLLLINNVPAFAGVVSAAYSASTGLTTVTVSKGVLTAQLESVQYGQDPNNAPAQQASSPTGILALNNNFVTA
jgi:hypothetical protein